MSRVATRAGLASTAYHTVKRPQIIIESGQHRTQAAP
jgi:hypothetical protein